jgi:tRNA 2-selenouridine synthase
VILDAQSLLSLRQQLPLVDVRSEGEFAAGHIPSAINIPILNNSERVAVGTDYKLKGQYEAIKTGFRLVGPRMETLVHQVRQIGTDLLVYCWRGGMRSVNFCQLVGMAGVGTRRLEGGYKAYRQLMLTTFKRRFRLVVIGGCTGSGKSEVLRALGAAGEQIVDLEALAHHKGSAFGGLMQPPQPTTEQFHNDLFEVLHRLDPARRIWVEDESMTIGSNVLPQELWIQMKDSQVITIEVDKNIRVQRLAKEYGQADRDDFLRAMQRITRKLGGQHFKAACEKLSAGDMPATIDILLNYYDKAYLPGLGNKKDSVRAIVPWNGADTHVLVAQLLKEVERQKVVI